MTKPRILGFAGSSRRDSFNKRLLTIAADGARQAGAEVTLIDLRDYELPLYDGDLEAADGLPTAAVELKKLFLEHGGLLLACPEYNSSVTPLLKNTLDWVSRPAKDEEPLAAYRDKVAALMSASPGGLGGMRGLVHVRAILGNIGVMVLPDQVSLSRAHDAWDDNGRLKDERRHELAEKLGRGLAETLTKLNV